MRLAAAAVTFVLAGCAGAPIDDTAAVERACAFTDCFAARNVRDFQVIDRTTLIVFVGQQRCPFQIELRGAFCDMTFATDVFFTRASDLQGGTAQRGPGDSLELPSLTSSNLVVCANDLQVDVGGGAFGEIRRGGGPLDRFGNPRSQCQIGTVVSLTDDQIMELYVAHNIVPPPPPIGAGEIEVGEQVEQGAQPPAGEGAATEAKLAGEAATGALD